MKYPNVHITIVGKPGTGKSRIAYAIYNYLASIDKSCVIGEGKVPRYTKAYIQKNKIFCTVTTEVK